MTKTDIVEIRRLAEHPGTSFAARAALLDLATEVERLRAQVAPADVTPEMLRAGQMTEAGGYVCANLSGGYELLTRLFKAMLAASPATPAQQAPSLTVGDLTEDQLEDAWLDAQTAFNDAIRFNQRGFAEWQCRMEAAIKVLQYRGASPPSQPAAQAEPVMANGLTEADTSATASVFGLTSNPAAQGVELKLPRWTAFRLVKHEVEELQAVLRAALAQAPAAEPLTMDQAVDAVREADIDWHTGWAGDPMEVNRYLQLIRIVERAHGIGA